MCAFHSETTLTYKQKQGSKTKYSVYVNRPRVNKTKCSSEQKQ
jgi:hypothetical protein